MKVLVTGGSRGIGAACVELFKKRGAEVAFIYRNNDDSAGEIAHSTGAVGLRADVSSSEDARLAVKGAVDALGGIDVLINNAGIARQMLFTDITDDDWKSMIDTDLGGVFNCTRAALPVMIRQKHGSIVNISSMWGITGASCEVHYSAAKAGVIGLTKALAKEVGPSNIRVNCVAPGVIRTDMNADFDEETMAGLCDETPLCRIGEPEEVARAVYFLASEEASFITGEVLSVNGGFVI